MNTSLARRPLPGLALAGITAVVSGVSVFVNSYGVHAIKDAAVYTTAKNIVAAVVLLVIAVTRSPAGRNSRVEPPASPGFVRPWARALALGYVGVVSGGVAFILFFDGLARTSAEPAAFLHDTLIVWVALLAWPTLRESISIANLAAVVILVVGQTLLVGGIGHLVLGCGLLLVLLATLLWSVEVVIAKRLLSAMRPERLAVVRMGIGVFVLLAYLAIDGGLSALAHLNSSQIGWALLTGGLLGTYVATWFGALARARALDVTSVLVASAAVTAALQVLAGHQLLGGQLAGISLVVVGAAVALAQWPRRALA
jgi:drug/metabolite transporter (DMT)-like permease